MDPRQMFLKFGLQEAMQVRILINTQADTQFHIDVGGGEDKDQRVHSLSNISLRWMCQEVSRSQCGILL